MKIVFVGAPGSGKTTLTAAVFAALKESGRRSELVNEWIRTDIALSGPMTSIWEQYRTRRHQEELEAAVPKEIDYVIIDGGVLLQYFYAVLYCDPTDARQRIVLQDMYKYFIDDTFLNRYDLIFYLPTLLPTDLKDGTRYQTEDEVKILDQHMKLLFTKIHRFPRVHEVISGMDQRLEEVMWKIFENDKSSYPPIVINQRKIPNINIRHRLTNKDIDLTVGI